MVNKKKDGYTQATVESECDTLVKSKLLFFSLGCDRKGFVLFGFFSTRVGTHTSDMINGMCSLSTSQAQHYTSSQLDSKGSVRGPNYEQECGRMRGAT